MKATSLANYSLLIIIHPMNVEQAIKERRSVKHYDPDHKMTKDELQKLIELTMESPTAFNLQHWRFLIVEDLELRKKIREASYNQAQVTDASLVVILAADLKTWNKNPERCWRNAPEETRKAMTSMIQGYYAPREQAQRDEIMRSCGIAGQTMMLAAKEMGYDTCAMDGFDFEKVGQLIHLPEDYVISFMVVVGKPLQAAWDKPGQLGFDEVVSYNHF